MSPPRRIAQCVTCHYFTPSMACVRYPRPVPKTPSDWCGEWHPEGDRLCYANGRQITPARLSSAPIKLQGMGITFPGFPARPASYVRCWLVKDHTGLHSNGVEDWENDTP